MGEREKTEKLREELGRFFHEELDRRYSREFLRELPPLRERSLLDRVPQERIDRVKEFFKRVMYPVGPEREARDSGVETLEELLQNTSSLLSVLPQLPGILLRHGIHLPAVTGAGLHVVSSYRRARQLENKVLERLRELLAEEDVSETAVPEELLRKAYAVLSEEETRRMLEETEKIVRLGMDRPLMRSTIDIVHRVRESRRNPREKHALEYVLSVLDEVRGLSENYNREEVHRILEISEITEAWYFESLRAEWA